MLKILVHHGWNARGTYEFVLVSEGVTEAEECPQVLTVGLPVTMQAVPPPEESPSHVADRNPGPTFTLTREETQDLVDALWSAGFRPTRHDETLKDIRRLLFTLLPKP